MLNSGFHQMPFTVRVFVCGSFLKGELKCCQRLSVWLERSSGVWTISLLGIVKDFIVDCQGECPTIYFAVEPDASLQLGPEYVIMPYGAMQYRDGSRGGGDYFAMGMNRIQLRNAPVAVNAWSAFNDRQVLGNAHQFYQRTERTTARPIEGGAAKPNEQGTRAEDFSAT